MSNYLIILFKNKKKQKIIKGFISFERANKYYEDILNLSNKVIFPERYLNGHDVKYELALLQKKGDTNFPVYITDEIGRNIKVNLDDSDFVINKISTFNVEERIFDLKLNKKITVDYFLNEYLSGPNLKLISVLNNKVIVQNEDSFHLFSVKNESESVRFVDCIRKHFFESTRTDCIFVTDTSTPQKKYLIDLLSKNGFDKKLLYRKYTTHPRPR